MCSPNQQWAIGHQGADLLHAGLVLQGWILLATCWPQGLLNSLVERGVLTCRLHNHSRDLHWDPSGAVSKATVPPMPRVLGAELPDEAVLPYWAAPCQQAASAACHGGPAAVSSTCIC